MTATNATIYINDKQVLIKKLSPFLKSHVDDGKEHFIVENIDEKDIDKFVEYLNYYCDLNSDESNKSMPSVPLNVWQPLTNNFTYMDVQLIKKLDEEFKDNLVKWLFKFSNFVYYIGYQQLFEKISAYMIYILCKEATVSDMELLLHK